MTVLVFKLCVFPFVATLGNIGGFRWGRRGCVPSVARGWAAVASLLVAVVSSWNVINSPLTLGVHQAVYLQGIYQDRLSDLSGQASLMLLVKSVAETWLQVGVLLTVVSDHSIVAVVCCQGGNMFSLSLLPGPVAFLCIDCLSTPDTQFTLVMR